MASQTKKLAETEKGEIVSSKRANAEGAASLSTRIPPAWYDEFVSALAYADHLVLSGNTRDIYPVEREGRIEFLNLVEAIRPLLRKRGIRDVLIYDPIEGLRLVCNSCDRLKQMLADSGVPLGTTLYSLRELADFQVRFAKNRELPVALVLDYAAHLHGRTVQELDNFFIAVDKASRAQIEDIGGVVPHNPTIWIAEHPADLPDWFIVGNDFLREIQLEHPNLEDRFLYASRLSREFRLSRLSGKTERKRNLQQFALQCDGETLVSMRAVAQVARDENLDLSKIEDAIRIHRTGARRNPWASPVLFSRVRQARLHLEDRIKGQPNAIEKTLDILARSIMGLSGAQSGPHHQKPRGVLFFAGPTGVGKTELAKAVTTLLFGDESACQRFDMSEFMEEGSIARLLGAPPGHQGYEKGGELVNAANRRPFSVFLFDEIEKAHPRVLDMFLQILDEGRLSDSRGTTAHFGQALIVFTSNIGVVQGSSETNMGMSVLPADSYHEINLKITRAVQDHFRTKLHRPELVSRIGQNIVVFDFLSHESASLIFDKALRRVLETVLDRDGIHISLEDKAYRELKTLCIHDYFEGGRGIGNRIETHFINPLARALFQSDQLTDLRILDLETNDNDTVLVFEPTRCAGSAQDSSMTGRGNGEMRPAPRRFTHEEVGKMQSHAPRKERPRLMD